MKKYLLSIEELLKQDGGWLLEESFSNVDAERRRKAERIKPLRSRAACLGAGLLLQLAVREAMEPGHCGFLGNSGKAAEGSPIARAADDKRMARYTVSGLLDRIRHKPPLPFSFRYGGRGKPYFRDYPFFFNLSHSGDYVICALSAEEVGADIQQHRAGAGGRIALRYFSWQEIAALESCKESKAALFFQLWTRKEAYGKLTGQGIAGAIGVNLLPEGGVFSDDRERLISGTVRDETRGILLSDGRILLVEEYRDIPGYSISFCHYSTVFHD